MRPFLRPPGVETPPHYQRGNVNNGSVAAAQSAIEDNRPGTPTVDEQRLPMPDNTQNSRPPPQQGPENYNMQSNMVDSYTNTQSQVQNFNYKRIYIFYITCYIMF